jgi:hypothetical protein
VASRRNRLLALAAIAAVAVVVLVVVLVSSGDGDTQAPAPPARAREPHDPQAADRAAIQHVAEAWRRALNPRSADNPCRYMTEQYAAILYDETKGSTRRALTCAEAVRKILNQGDVPLYQATQGGLARISFSSNVPVQAVPSAAPGARGTWRAQGYPPVSFVRRGGEWKVAG